MARVATLEPTWFGHPRGISTLFFTEMWERFSYYGMRAFLILYMTAPPSKGGLGFDVEKAGSIYGNYTGSVWMVTIGGGLVADWLLGQYRSALLGAALITLGHFTLAFHSLTFFYLGLIFIVIGTGLLKPNVSTMVGSLYDKDDPRRDAGFSIFYMGINLGAATGPLIAGTLAESNWHIGFACAGVGMAFGLVQYIMGRKYLQPAIDKLEREAKAAKAASKAGQSRLAFTSQDWKRLAAIFIFFIFASIFWACYEQAGSTLNLFARDHVRLSILGLPLRVTWFQSIPAIFVIAMAPIFAWLWIRLGPKEPSSPVKFTLGLIFAGLGFLLLVPGASIAQSAGIRISPMWLVGVYFLHVVGELCLSPVGLSLVTKLAPHKVVGFMMGVWFLSIAVGSKIGGKIAGLTESYPLPPLFTYVGLTAIASAIILALLIKPIKNLMGGIH